MLPPPNKFNLKEKRKNVNQGRGIPETPWMRLLSGAPPVIPGQHVERGLPGRKGQHWGHFGLGVSIV